MTKHSHEKIPLWKRTVAAGTIGIAGLSLAACTPTSEKPPATAPTTTETPPTPEPTPTTTTGEFTPGASGDFSPAELRDLSEPELIERFAIRGSTPEELAESAEQTLVAFLMSGTTEEELEPYKDEQGGLTFDTRDQFAEDMDEKYNHAACVAWGGYAESSDCYVNEDVRILHKIILEAYAMNRMTGMLFPDYQLGATETHSVEVIKGEFEGNPTIRTIATGTSNYEGSIMEYLTGGVDTSYNEYFASAQGWDKKKELIQDYKAVGDEQYIVAKGKTTVLE